MTINIPKKAMVFAAGFGKRMLPITEKIPKPLVRVKGKSLIDYSLDSLAKVGVKEAVVNTHHLADAVKGHIDLREDGPLITISHEKEILETGGGVLKAIDFFKDEPFYIVNSDIIWLDGKQPALLRLAEHWDPEKMDALWLLCPLKKAVGYDGAGDFNLTKDGRLTTEDKKYVFMGVQIIKPEIFNGFKAGPCALYKDIIYKKYIKPDASLDRIYGLVHDGGWLHIGTPDGIRLAEESL